MTCTYHNRCHVRTTTDVTYIPQQMACTYNNRCYALNNNIQPWQTLYSHGRQYTAMADSIRPLWIFVKIISTFNDNFLLKITIFCSEFVFHNTLGIMFTNTCSRNGRALGPHSNLNFFVLATFYLEISSYKVEISSYESRNFDLIKSK